MSKMSIHKKYDFLGDNNLKLQKLKTQDKNSRNSKH